MNAIAFTAAALAGNSDTTRYAIERMAHACPVFKKTQCLDAPEVRGDPEARAWDDARKPDTELQQALAQFHGQAGSVPSFSDIVKHHDTLSVV